MKTKNSLLFLSKLKYVFLVALLFRLVLAPLASHPDIRNHVDWGIRFFEYGADKFYAPESNVWSFTWPNQPPGTILIFAFVRRTYELIFNIFWQINIYVPVFPSPIISLIDKYLYIILLKLPAILADLGIAYVIYKFLVKHKGLKAAKIGAILFLFNPVIWYNSAVWGQTDSVVSLMALLSLWFLLAKKPILSALSLALCLYIKISLAVFIPIYLILFLKHKFAKKRILVSVVLPIMIFAVLTLPFSYPHEPFGWLIMIYKEKVLANQLQVITANAFNLWALLTGIKEQPHSLFFGPISYQLWGVALFILSIVPLLFKVIRRPGFDNAIWALALTSFSSFMFLTNMHERYLYPLFPYLTILVALNTKLLPIYIGVSGISLLNLYHLWWVPKINISEQVYNAFDNLLPRALSLVNLCLYLLTFSFFWKSRPGKNII